MKTQYFILRFAKYKGSEIGNIEVHNERTKEKYASNPDVERGERASQTGRDHIPARIFKEAVHLNRLKEQILAILNDTNPFNKKAKLDELHRMVDVLPSEILQAAKQVAAHKQQER